MRAGVWGRPRAHLPSLVSWQEGDLLGLSACLPACGEREERA